MRFVDAHHHYQDLERHDYPWLRDKDAPPKLEGDLEPIRKNYLLGEYLQDLSMLPPEKSVHIQNGWNPADPVGETRWLQGQADGDGFPHAIVAYADLLAPDVEHDLTCHAEHPNLRGIRQILNWHENPVYRVADRSDLMEDGGWRRGFSLLRHFGLSFDLQIYWPQMEDAYNLACQYPDITIILNHFGMPVDRSEEGVYAWRKSLRRLAEADNVCVKISGMGLGHPRWNAADTVPLLQDSVEAFGIERCMLGTNLPVDNLFAPAEQTLAAFVDLTTEFSEGDREAIFAGNAERFYRI